MTRSAFHIDKEFLRYMSMPEPEDEYLACLRFHNRNVVHICLDNSEETDGLLLEVWHYNENAPASMYLKPTTIIVRNSSELNHELKVVRDL